MCMQNKLELLKVISTVNTIWRAFQIQYYMLLEAVTKLIPHFTTLTQFTLLTIFKLILLWFAVYCPVYKMFTVYDYFLKSETCQFISG